MQVTDETQELGSHLHTVVDDIESKTECDFQFHQSVLSKLTLNVQGVGEVHKSTAIAMLHSSPCGISVDRLKRVRSSGMRHEKHHILLHLTKYAFLTKLQYVETGEEKTLSISLPV